MFFSYRNLKIVSHKNEYKNMFHHKNIMIYLSNLIIQIQKQNCHNVQILDYSNIYNGKHSGIVIRLVENKPFHGCQKITLRN